MGVLETGLPCAEAFFMAAAAIYLDCYQTARKQVVRVPSQVLKARGVILLAAAGGLVAVGIYLYTSYKLVRSHSDISPLDTILSLKIDNNYLRAPYVGILSLAIIRSKLLDLKGAPVGVEYLYTEGRLRALVPALMEWNVWRNQFIFTKKTVAFAYTNYFSDLDGLLAQYANLDGAPPETDRALKEVQKQKTTTPMDPVSWDLYYRTLTRLALDTLGPRAFKGMPGF